MHENRPDSWEWLQNQDGVFSVASLSMLADQYLLKKASQLQSTQWNKWVPKKINIFIWRALQDRLPTCLQLAIRGAPLQMVGCQSCNCPVESLDHRLVECRAAALCWHSLFLWCDGAVFDAKMMVEALSAQCPISQPSKSQIQLWDALKKVCAWFIWRSRNDKIFKEKQSAHTNALANIQMLTYL